MADELKNAIQQNAGGPAEASGDSGSMKQHKLTEQIAAAKFLSSQTAASGKGLGIKLNKIKPGGTA